MNDWIFVLSVDNKIFFFARKRVNELRTRYKKPQSLFFNSLNLKKMKKLSKEEMKQVLGGTSELEFEDGVRCKERGETCKKSKQCCGEMVCAGCEDTGLACI